MDTTSNIHNLSSRHAHPNSNNPMTVRASSPSSTNAAAAAAAVAAATAVLNAATGISTATNPTSAICDGTPSGAYLSAASAVDANSALQAAYLALQTQNQLQQQQQISEMSAYGFPLLTSSTATGLPQTLTSAEATERLLLAQANLLVAHAPQSSNISPNSLLSAVALLQPDASSSVSVCTSGCAPSSSCSSSPSITACSANMPSTAAVAAAQRPVSPSRQTSAFSLIRAIGNPITSTAPSRPAQQYATPSSPTTIPTTTTLDMMLLQMQMAAAAAGLVQTPFNLLAPSNLNASAANTALVNGLLAPHLRLQQSSAGNGIVSGLEAALSNASLTGDCTAATVSSLAQQLAAAAAVSANPAIMTNPLMTQPQNLFEQPSLNDINNANNAAAAAAAPLLVRPSSSMPGSPSKSNETSPIPLPRCYSMGKQQQQRQFSMKRPHHSISNSSDMAVLRSLCNDTETPEITLPPKRRTKTVANDSELDRRLLAAEVMASGLKEMKSVVEHRPRRSENHQLPNDSHHHRSSNRKGSNADGAVSSYSSSTTISHPKAISVPATSSKAECSQQIPSGDPNSPNRHHPLNHQPPAMEARFLECMAAIVLHSDFAIPTTSSSTIQQIMLSSSSTNRNETINSQGQQSNKYDSPQSSKSSTHESEGDCSDKSNERNLFDKTEDVSMEIDRDSPKSQKTEKSTDVRKDDDNDDDITIIDENDVIAMEGDAEDQGQDQENNNKNQMKKKDSTMSEKSTNSQRNESEFGDDMRIDRTDTTTKSTEEQQQTLTERLMHKSEKRTWPTTAIDDELCKELENYKGTNVKMIHAYVIPPRSDTSSSSGESLDDRGHSPPFQSVPSLAVPVPILNILLERILHTMLQT